MVIGWVGGRPACQLRAASHLGRSGWGWVREQGVAKRLMAWELEALVFFWSFVTVAGSRVKLPVAWAVGAKLRANCVRVSS
jgi:hypothetical protein